MPIPCGVALVCSFALTAFAPERETWDAIFIGNAKVGSIHTVVTPLKDRDRGDVVRVEVTTELNVKRSGDVAQMKLRYGAIETLDGEVLRIDTLITTGRDRMRVFGEVKGAQMGLKLEASGKTTEQKVPWGPEVRGPYGPEFSLVREPMAPGGRRALKVFLPEVNTFALVTLEAQTKEDVKLGGGTKSLLKVTSKVTDQAGRPMPELSTTYWVDERGEPLKTTTDAFGGTVTYRTTKAGATSAGEYAKLDLLASTIIKPKSKITNPYKTREVVYRVALKEGKLSDVIVQDRRQALKAPGDGRVGDLVVKTAGPRDGQALADPLASECLQPSPIVDSKDPRVMGHSAKAVGQLAGAPEKAAAIVNWVHSNMKTKNFETTFATATEVARDLAGDCTEHAVLVAAMCRAAGVPCKAAVGLIYAESLNGFGFHMWNEVYLNGRWVAMDAAFQQTEVDAVHVKLGDSTLNGVSPFEGFLPVIQASNKLTIEPVTVK